MAGQTPLQELLQHYSAGGLYPMHMPGHKRRICPAPGLPYDWDLTEVEGVDDLHCADGILADAMERTAALHGAARTWYLVGGSTCGLLAGIRALAPAGSRIICARNCHKAVYHAIELGSLSVRWLMPEPVEGWGICGSVTPEQVKAALADTPDAACLVLTSPTYEGVLSDIAVIAALCHEKGVPLLVDEAHGAHLGLFPGWPDSAVRLGADLVVQSAHKTLPSLTQTALLHLGTGSLADPEEVERQLGIFETSSPSYPLMASLDGCTGILLERGEELFARWREGLARFDAGVSGLERLRVLCHGIDRAENHPEIFGFDPGKLPVGTAGTALAGPALAARLRADFGFELEMACGTTALAMTGPGDEPEALERLATALRTLDSGLAAVPRPAALAVPPPGETVCTAAEAVVRRRLGVPMAEAEGRICAEYIWAYPPGIPLTAPGERVTAAFLSAAAALEAAGTPLRHTHCKQAGFMDVLA